MAAPRTLFLAGPTAVGKSAVALLLAERLGGEIISVDSMQVYRGLDLGTAKPSMADQRRVRHHLIDIVDLAETFDAAAFVRHARAAEADILSRGKLPIFCGGTGLYFQALLAGLGEAPPTDAALRAQLETLPLPELLAELEHSDPETFTRIDRRNPRRVVRAIEVIRLTGRPFSAQRAVWQPSANASGPVVVGITRPPGTLRRRIDERVVDMFARGLVDETRRLLAIGLARNRTAMQALGYRQVVAHLQGELSLAETIALVQARTWLFARRQSSWFRNQMHCDWIEWCDGEALESVASRILQLGRSPVAAPAASP